MKSSRQNYKMNEIISLSQNYKLHRKNLDTIKPTINSNSNKHKQSGLKKLAEEKLRYRQAIRNYNDSCLKRQNTKIIDRIARVSEERDHRRRSLEQKLKQSKFNFSPYNPDRSISRTSSKHTFRHQRSIQKLNSEQGNQTKSRRVLKSMSSSRSLSSISSNYRQRTLRQKQIQRQNVKIAARITNPKSIRTLALDELNKSYRKQKEYVRIRSRFSQRNQQIIKSLAMQGLRLDKKDVQYLPQLTTKRLKSNSKLQGGQKIQWNSNLK